MTSRTWWLAYAALTLAVCSLAATPQAQSQAPVRVTGTVVSLIPPAGFLPAERYPGFERQDLRASIMVSELPGPAAVMQRGMTSQALASRGMRLLGSTRHRIDGQEALLLHVAQDAGGYEAVKWMLVAGDDRATVMVVATFPTEFEGRLSEAVRTSVLSATRASAAPRAADHFEGLPFRVTPTPALKIAGRISNMLVLTETGSMAPQGSDTAIFIVGTSLAEVGMEDLRAFAETRVRQTDKVSSVRIVEGRDVRLGGRAAYEIVAEATEEGGGKSLTVYQVLLPDGGGYVLMQGLVSASRGAALVPEFRRVANTFTSASP
jgi:hypothetical protein